MMQNFSRKKKHSNYNSLTIIVFFFSSFSLTRSFSPSDTCCRPPDYKLEEYLEATREEEAEAALQQEALMDARVR